MTEGISEKVYNKIINQIIENLPVVEEWHSKNIMKKFKDISWNKSIKALHKPENIGNHNSNFYAWKNKFKQAGLNLSRC